MLLGSVEDNVADESGVAVSGVLLNSSLLGSSRGSLGLGLLGLGRLLGVEDTGGLREEADSLDSAGDKSSAGNAGGKGRSRSLGRDSPRSREGRSKSGTTDGLPEYGEIWSATGVGCRSARPFLDCHARKESKQLELTFWSMGMRMNGWMGKKGVVEKRYREDRKRLPGKE